MKTVKWILHKLGWHDYGKWGDTYIREGAFRIFSYQRRKCQMCKYVQERCVERV